MAAQSTEAQVTGVSFNSHLTLPPLESGDRLTRREFERRYEALPGVKAELIEGVVYMASPVRVVRGRPHGFVMTWLGLYCAETPGVDLLDNTTVRLDSDNEVQPDALLRIESDQGGRSRISADGYVEGPPELVVEIAASSAAIDLHDKKTVYRRNGVQEYIVWQIHDQRLDWWELHDDEYRSLVPDQDGIIASRVFPGLRLALPALFDGNRKEVLLTLRAGIESVVHREFLARLSHKGGV